MANDEPELPPPPEADQARGCNPLFLVLLAAIVAIFVYVVWIDNPLVAPGPAKVTPAVTPSTKPG